MLLTLAACTRISPSAEVTGIGLYTATSTSKVDEPRSLSGAVSESSSVQLVTTTTRIPAVIGTRFGFGYVLRGLDAQDYSVRYVWRFPDGGLVNTTTGQSARDFQIERSCRVGESCFNAWVFSYDWELKPGTWTAEVWVGREKLISRDFEIYLPQNIPGRTPNSPQRSSGATKLE